jgi:hypothetical protein
MDRYRQKLQHAAWTWREEKVCRFHGDARNKDRMSGRAEKRSAKQKDRKEIERDSELPTTKCFDEICGCDGHEES